MSEIAHGRTVGTVQDAKATEEAAYRGGAEVGSRSEDAMDLSTKLKITAVLATVLMAVLWAVPVPV